MSTYKELTAHAVMRAGGNIAAAKLLGVSAQEISNWCNLNLDRFIPIDHLVDLDAHADDLFLKSWAAQRGYDLVAREPDEKSENNIFKIIGQFSKECGELDCTTLETAADKHLTPTETRGIRERIRPVKDSIEELERFLAH